MNLKYRGWQMDLQLMRHGYQVNLVDPRGRKHWVRDESNRAPKILTRAREYIDQKEAARGAIEL